MGVTRDFVERCAAVLLSGSGPPTREVVSSDTAQEENPFFFPDAVYDHYQCHYSLWLRLPPSLSLHDGVMLKTLLLF